MRLGLGYSVEGQRKTPLRKGAENEEGRPIDSITDPKMARQTDRKGKREERGREGGRKGSRLRGGWRGRGRRNESNSDKEKEKRWGGERLRQRRRKERGRD